MAGSVVTDELGVPDRIEAVEGEAADDDPRLKQIRERYKKMETGWAQVHAHGLEDDKFVAGHQWRDDVRKEREDEGRPVHTYNLLLTYCHNIVNQIRQNWPQIRVQPVDTMRGRSPRMANVSGSADYDIADVYMGIIRNIEHQSKAKHAYTTASEHQTQHGFGYFRLMPEYKAGSFHQDLFIKRVMNSYSVLVDPDCEEADFSDMADAFVHQRISRSAFQQRWPDAKAATFDGTLMGQVYQDWFESDMVRIAEYMWLEYEEDEVFLLSDGSSVWKSQIEDVLDELKEQTGIHKLAERRASRPKCMWQKMTACDVLEGPIELPFSRIPIFPVVGKELIVDGKVQYQSAIRNAKDAQQAFNYWKTASTETVALAPRAPWLLTPEQIEGHEADWEQANRKNLPYLEYNHMEGHPPPQRIFPQGVAAAELQQAASEQEVIQDIIGLHEASLGEPSNEKSGKAIIARQNRGDLATYVFPDNLTRAVESLGRCLVEAIPRVYDAQRIVRIRMPDDSEDFVEINQAILDEDTGTTKLIHDISYGAYDVVIETGPNYATQRQESQQAIIELLNVLPEHMRANIAHKAVQKMSFDGADEVYAVLVKMIPDELKSESEKEASLPRGYKLNEQGQPENIETGEPLPPPQPTPEQQVQMEEHKAKQAGAQADMKDAEAKIAGAQADMAKHEATKAKAQADLEAAKAKIMELQASGQNDEAMAGLLQQVEQMIMAALNEHNEEVDEKITDAVVDTLKRVKTRMDSQTPAEAPQPQQTSPVINIHGSKVEKVNFERDDEGITAAVPTYEE